MIPPRALCVVKAGMLPVAGSVQSRPQTEPRLLTRCTDSGSSLIGAVETPITARACRNRRQRDCLPFSAQTGIAHLRRTINREGRREQTRSVQVSKQQAGVRSMQ